jgi:hypothetical protein
MFWSLSLKLLHLLLVKHYYNDQVKEDEMSGAHSTNGDKKSCMLLVESQNKKDHCADQDLGRWKILCYN